MGVLAVAGSETRAVPRTADSPESGGRMELATRITAWLEEFISGLLLFDGTVEINWTLLNPMFSALSAIATTLAIGGFV